MSRYRISKRPLGYYCEQKLLWFWTKVRDCDGGLLFFETLNEARDFLYECTAARDKTITHFDYP